MSLCLQPTSTFAGSEIVFTIAGGRLLPLQDGSAVAADTVVPDGDSVAFVTGADPSTGAQIYCGVVRSFHCVVVAAPGR